MNNSQGALYFGAGIDMTQWRQNINEMRRDILGLSQNTAQQTKQMDTSFRNLGIGIATYFSGAALGNFINQVINIRGEFQKTEIAFGTMLKSTDKAKELMAQMVELASKTPFSLQDVSDGAKRLLAFQIPAEQVVETLTRIGNVAAGLGVPMGQLIHVYGQVKAQGRLMTNDLYQFMNAGIPMTAELAKVMGVAENKVKDLITEGKVGFPQVQQVIQNLTNEGGMFFNLMEAQSGSLSGQMANLGDSFDQMLNSIGQANEGVLNDAISAATYLVENYETVIEVIGVAIAAYGTYRAALMATVAWQQLSAGAALQQALAQGTLTTAQSYGAAATVALQRAQLGLNAAMMANPIGIVIGLIAGLSYVIYKNITATTQWEELQSKLNETTRVGIDRANEQQSKISSLIGVIRNKNVSDDQAKKALDEINRITGNRIKGLTVEGIRLGQNTTALGAYIEMLKKEARAKALIESITLAEKDNDRINRDDPNRLTLGERVGNFDNVNDIGKTAQDRKREAMIRDRIANNKVIRESNKELQKLAAEGVDITQNSGSAEAAAINDATDKVKKAAEKKARELAEVYSLNSIADLEQRISLWNEALQKASGDTVDVLAKNKFGDTVKTGRTVTVAQALEEQERLEVAKAKRLREIQKLSFEEEMAEMKRQIEVRDKLLQAGYSQETVDTMFPKVQDKSYLQYLEETAASLNKLVAAGDKTPETAANIIAVTAAIEEFKGLKTNIEAVNDEIEDLKRTYSGLELIDKLEDYSRVNAGDTETERQERKKAVNAAIDSERKAIQDSYDQILEDQRTYEEQKLALQKKYDALRLLATTEAEKAKVEAAFKEESGAIDAEAFKKTDLYAKAFGNLERVGVNALGNLRDQLQKYLEVNKDLSPENIQVIQEAIEKIEQAIGDRNPFLELSNAIEVYQKERKKLAEIEKKHGKDSPEYIDQLKKVQQAFVGLADAAKGLAVGFIATVQEIGNAFGSLSDEANQTLTEVQNLLDGVMDAVKGYFSGNYAQMLAGIVQIISAIVKLANGDIRRAKNINAWQREVNELALAYERLERVIEKTAGDATLAKQRELIANLQKQQEILRKMRNEENAKKKADKDKVADYTNQISEINYQIEELVDSFMESITTVEFKSLSEKLADALTSAWQNGGNAALEFGKVVDDVMRQAVQNALRIKFLEPAVQKMVDQLYASMGFGGPDDAGILEQIKNGQASIAQLEAALASGNLGPQQTAGYKAAIASLKEKIAALQAQLAANQQAGAFDGLTDAEREAIKAMGITAMEQYTAALAEYEELFGAAGGAAQGMKGDIKGITEKTAGALESQVNAIRIYQVEAINIQKKNAEVFMDSLKNLVAIEWNTRRLHSIDDGIKELNSKVKKSLAGVP